MSQKLQVGDEAADAENVPEFKENSNYAKFSKRKTSCKGEKYVQHHLAVLC